MTNTSPTPTPRRTQRRRTKGWRKPDNCVIVSRPSRFGNPFTIKDAIEAEWSEPHRACADNYAEWLRVGTEGGWYQETYRIGKQVLDRRRILADLHLLRGKDLACTCPLPEPGQPDHCHAAVLLKLASAAPAPAADRAAVIADAIGHTMLLGLQDAELFDEPGQERIRDWIKWISETVAALPAEFELRGTATTPAAAPAVVQTDEEA